MQIIKLNATDSTNAYLKNLMLTNDLEDLTIVLAEEQLKGRGQMGAKWESEAGKNLTFSILKKINDMSVSDQFLLNICVSLAVYNSLKLLQIPNLSVKWPNDILSGNSKICGILIENILSGHKIHASILGVGLNVNQTEFNNLQNVSSLKLLLGNTLDLDELLRSIITGFNKLYVQLISNETGGLEKAYEKVLFRKDKPSTFKNTDDELFMGFIKGVSHEGKLQVVVEDNELRQFDLKEIKLLY